MALLYWLPLRGTLDNNGINNAQVTLTNATIDQQGKLGTCYDFSAGGDIRFAPTGLNELSECSIMSWIYLTANPSGKVIWSIEKGTYWQITLCDNGLQIRDNGQGPGGTRLAFSFGALELDTWIHLAIVYNQGTILIYKNGALINTYTTNGIKLNTGIDGVCIGDTIQRSYNFKGKINDFRIYNEALSIKEIKSITQALVIHYTLDDWCPVGYRKLEYLASTSNQILSLETNQAADIHYEMKCSCSANNSNYLMGSKQMGSMGYNGMYRLTGMEINYGSVGGLNVDVTINQPFILRQYLNETGSSITSVLNGKSNTHAFGNLNANDNGDITIFGIPNASVRPYQGTIKLYWLKIKNLQGIVRDLIPAQRISDGVNGLYDLKNNEFLCTNINTAVTTGFTAGPIIADNQTTTVYDCSGYKLNGTRNGILNISTSTPRYHNCMYFPAVLGTTYIKVPFADVNKDRFYTFNVWFNKDKQSTCPWDTIFGAGSGYELEMRTTSAAGSLNKIYLYSWGSKAMGTDEYTLNEWHMLTFCQDTEHTYVYLDGQLLGTSIPRDPIAGQYYLAAWNGRQNYQGYLSDMRIYCSCLSAEEVLELYNTSMMIDTNGNIIPRILS